MASSTDSRKKSRETGKLAKAILEADSSLPSPPSHGDLSPLSRATELGWHTLVASPASQLRHSAQRFLGRRDVPFEACAVALVLIYVVLTFLGLKALRGLTSRTAGAGGRRGSGRRVVLLGSSGSGKTSLFLLLRNGVVTETVPSMQENIEAVRVSACSRDGDPDIAEDAREASQGSAGGAEIELVDFPGHARFQGLAKPFIDSAAALLFLVDSSDKAAVKAGAEQLYELFATESLHRRQTPLLLVVNKTDLPESRSQESVVEDLEREIERSRASRSALLEGEDDAANFIGIEGEAFKILAHAPNPVEVCSCAVKTNDIDQVREFLLRHFASA
ncbi:signal recognition particle receptor beta subunit protein [Besnoitia besnoiti]|uniref:Signal recognition particle receptor subunit beta n=1 Tax=Besnoitia besnoiti TaxID=94643 RepID=A0A2A9MHE9_BESBE|nr:signal recognition particle receptor beta subunit protein [Besnoitia besnoiti]PFH36594.1 signal recognition particle receptor beta subunit protein [Besnoitia besnoiti]